MSSSSRKGDRAERALSDHLEDDRGYYAQRTASSGAATDRNRPDVLAFRPGTVFGTVAYAIECKAWADGTGHFDREEIVSLLELSERGGAHAVVAVKPDLRRHDQWHVFYADELHETPGGNFSIRKADLPGSTLDDVFGTAPDTDSAIRSAAAAVAAAPHGDDVTAETDADADIDFSQ